MAHVIRTAPCLLMLLSDEIEDFKLRTLSDFTGRHLKNIDPSENEKEL